MNLKLPRLAAIATLPCLFAVAHAQTTVTFPSDHQNHAGQYSSTNFPYAYGVSRIQAVYEAWDLGLTPGTPIARLGVRQDGVQAAAGRSLQLEVRMGYTARTATTLLTSFDANYAAPSQTVFGPALFTLPQLTNSQPGQQVVWLDLTTPFLYQPANGNLLIEWRVLANSNGNSSFTYPLDRANFLSPVTASAQPGCPHSGNATATLLSQPTSIGTNWRIAVNNAPASSLVFLCVDVGGTLVPGYSLQGFVPGIGASCFGFLTPGSFAVLTAPTSTSGYYQWSIAVPGNLAFHDITMASQALIPDFFAPGGLVTSNGDQVQFGVDPAQTLLYSQGSVSAATGSLWPNYGLITLFQ